jgi:HEPN domain-containing protein
MKSKADLVNSWIGYAHDDLRAAHKLFADETSLYKIVCFHCQQCAEKIFKAYLLLLGIEILKSHDLELLAFEKQKRDQDIQLNVDSLIQLSRYAVETRYPDNFEDLTKEETELSLKTASEILTIIQNKIEKELK